MKYAFLLLFCLSLRAAEKIDAAALLQDITGRAPTEERQIMGTLKIRPAEGKQRSIPIRWMVFPGGAKWRDVYQTPQSADIPPEIFAVTHTEGSTNSYEFTRAGQKIPGIATNLFQPFGASDFWLVDLGLDFFHWPNPKHYDTEMRKSRPCYVIESLNPSPRAGAYKRVLSWLDVESGGLVRAEAYDHNDKLLKTFTISNIKKIEGRWHIKELHIQNEQTDSSTRLAFDLKVADQ